jgi:hypothetical protein
VAAAGFEPATKKKVNRDVRHIWGAGQHQHIKLECPKDSHTRKCSATKVAMRLLFGRLYDVTISFDTSVSNQGMPCYK